jgi:hypothetical protein
MTRILTLISVAAALVSLGAGAAASGTTPASFAFGRTGGNIQPFTVTIAKTGSVRATGPVQVVRHQITARTLARLTTLATTEHFFSLRRQVSCPGTLPDFAFRSVTVSTAAASRTVLVRGDCRPGFSTLYAALSAAVGVR